MNTHSDCADRWRRRARKSIALASLSAVLLGLCATSSWASVQGVECASPWVWSGAAVNAVVHPYQYAGQDNRPLSETARQLTQLAHMNVLFSMLKYGGVGAITLTTRGVSPEAVRYECSPEIVMQKILGEIGGAKSEIKENRGVVMLSGFVYEERGDVYVQSFVRFLRRDNPGRIALNLQAAGADGIEVTGSFTDQALAFAPRKLTKHTLNEIAGAFLSTAKVHDQPRETSRAHDVVVDPDVQLSFRVMGASEGWMRISSMDSGVEGWIKATPSLGDKRLDEQLPEIHFVDALVGYMRYRMAIDGTVEYGKPESILEWTRNALGSFEEQAGEKRSPAAAATARILLGNLEILSANQGSMIEAVTAAGRHYAKAVEITPSSATARNLDAMARIYLGHSTEWADESPNDVAIALQEGLALDTRNMDITANLEALFSLISGLPESTSKIDKEHLERKIAAVKRVRAHQARP